MRCRPAALGWKVCTGRGRPERARVCGGVVCLLDKLLVPGWPLTSLPSPLKWKETLHLASPRRGQGGTHRWSRGPFGPPTPGFSGPGTLDGFTLSHGPSRAAAPGTPQASRARPDGEQTPGNSQGPRAAPLLASCRPSERTVPCRAGEGTHVSDKGPSRACGSGSTSQGIRTVRLGKQSSLGGGTLPDPRGRLRSNREPGQVTRQPRGRQRPQEEVASMRLST